MGLLWVYETVAFILTFLAVTGIHETEPWAHPMVIKWLVFASVLVNLVVWFYLFFSVRLSRKTYTWHFGLVIWPYAFSLIALFWWDHFFGGPINPAVIDRAYILAKIALFLAAISGFISITSATIAVRTQFARFESRRLSKAAITGAGASTNTGTGRPYPGVTVEIMRH